MPIHNAQFYEKLLDNITDGVYILDEKGNYIFVNRVYVHYLNMPKKTLLDYNVYKFLETGQIDFCISDLVYREKRQVVMFQDVLDPLKFGRSIIRQLVISTPIFDETGNITNILAITRPLDKQEELYKRAVQCEKVSLFKKDQSFTLRDGTRIIADSSSMKSLLEAARIVAKVDSNVLITGESGTGKEVLAKYIHDTSPRADKSFVVINCASLPETLLEAELFGYEKGAFTGASSAKKGLFEESDGGTLFLDEINSLPLNLQGKVLRAIETKQIQHIGSNKTIFADFRLLSAANEDLKKLAEQRLFRFDLYYRINVIPFQIPSLKERRDDIEPLAQYFLNYYCEKYKKEKMFTIETLDIFKHYKWPGNVRELRNVVERAVVMSCSEYIQIQNISSLLDDRPGRPCIEPMEKKSDRKAISKREQFYEKMIEEGINLKEYLSKCGQDYVEWAIGKYGNTYLAAKKLGTSQSSVVRRKRKVDN